MLALMALMTAPGALAASPEQIYADYADNGRLDGQYSKADLQRALKDVTLQGYKDTSRPRSDVLQSSKTVVRRPTFTTTRRTGSLPFTGAELGIFTIVGLGLIASGVLLRLSGRQRPTA
ncbi:MAG: hypothetical protein M3M94_07210 [Actinomycetota bacterium]|nr:hypothetical protein [Actinomycetota bacterium]